ncbi:hypothetical protein BRARA_C03865 [Brassica rapa]|uniref:Uncharacterized protein n=1 Tax=Brassica campestris TaxID=3711 RepID=A0A398A9M2_BRACM|nr:hypothetical protein BRARA_C03865 [Brassica rapa]
MNQSSVVVENISHGPYTIPPPIGYPARDVAGGDPVVDAVDTKSKGDDDGYFRDVLSLFCLGFKMFNSSDIFIDFISTC